MAAAARLPRTLERARPAPSGGVHQDVGHGSWRRTASPARFLSRPRWASASLTISGCRLPTGPPDGHEFPDLLFLAGRALYLAKHWTMRWRRCRTFNLDLRAAARRRTECHQAKTGPSNVLSAAISPLRLEDSGMGTALLVVFGGTRTPGSSWVGIGGVCDR